MKRSAPSNGIDIGGSWRRVSASQLPSMHRDHRGVCLEVVSRLHLLTEKIGHSLSLTHLVDGLEGYPATPYVSHRRGREEKTREVTGQRSMDDYLMADSRVW